MKDFFGGVLCACGIHKWVTLKKAASGFCGVVEMTLDADCCHRCGDLKNPSEFWTTAALMGRTCGMLTLHPFITNAKP